MGVSLNGLADLHDELRGVSGAFDQGMITLARAHELGLHTSVNTQIGPCTAGDLPGLLDLLASVGVGQWELQLTVAIGNAADNPDLILQPYELLALMPLLADHYRAALARGVLVMPEPSRALDDGKSLGSGQFAGTAFYRPATHSGCSADCTRVSTPRQRDQPRAQSRQPHGSGLKASTRPA